MMSGPEGVIVQGQLCQLAHRGISIAITNIPGHHET